MITYSFATNPPLRKLICNQMTEVDPTILMVDPQSIIKEEINTPMSPMMMMEV
jgi:hypothetical protein